MIKNVKNNNNISKGNHNDKNKKNDNDEIYF